MASTSRENSFIQDYIRSHYSTDEEYKSYSPLEIANNITSLQETVGSIVSELYKTFSESWITQQWENLQRIIDGSLQFRPSYTRILIWKEFWETQYTREMRLVKDQILRELTKWMKIYKNKTINEAHVKVLKSALSRLYAVMIPILDSAYIKKFELKTLMRNTFSEAYKISYARSAPAPSGQPSPAPSGQPSSAPSGQPSSAPSGQPPPVPSVQPSPAPSVQPSPAPSVQPPAPSIRPDYLKKRKRQEVGLNKIKRKRAETKMVTELLSFLF